MKIPGYMNVKINDAYLQSVRPNQVKKGNDNSNAPGPLKTKKDEIVLSPRATEIRELEGAVKAVPEARQEKIEAIKGQIASSTYNAKGVLVAQKISDLIG